MARPPSAGIEADDSPIEVTVIGGYLGAGKTTLVNHILRNADARIAVIVNDFGDVNIDADLIESQDGDTLTLDNGCICCSMIDGFSAALATIADLPNRPDRLVIEASGVADPSTVAAYGHGPGLRLDAVVVVADAESIRDSVTDRYVGDTVRRQLEAADIIVLNKLDLLVCSAASDVEVWIRTTAPSAFIWPTSHAVVPNEALFGEATTRHTKVGQPHNTGNDHDPEHLFQSWTITKPEPLSRAELASLMSNQGDRLVRAKGSVWLTDRPDTEMLYQQVGSRSTLIARRPWPNKPHTTIVAIALAEPAVDSPDE